MSLKNNYEKLINVADKVATSMKKVYAIPQNLEEDILSTAQLNVFEFCNLKADKNVDDTTLEQKCYEYVYQKVHKFYRTEMKQYYIKSTNAPVKFKGEETDQLEDTISSKDPSSQEMLERKYAKQELQKVFSSLSSQDKLIFNSVIHDKQLQLYEIAKIHGITENKIKQIVDKVLKKISDNVGDFAYEKYYSAVAKSNQQRLLNLLQNYFFWGGEFPSRMRKILKARYVLNKSTKDIGKKLGLKRVDIVRRTIEKLKILAGEKGEEPKAKLIDRINKEREMSSFFNFVKNDDSCKKFLQTISAKKRQMFIRHFFNHETLPEISKIYHCSVFTAEEICFNVLNTLKKYINADEEEKFQILSSLKRTGTYHKCERLDLGMKKVVQKFLKLPNYKQIIAAFPKDDQIIINDYLVLGKTSSQVAEHVKIAKSGVQRRGNLLCKKLEVFTHGSDVEQKRALQMLHKNHWVEHKIKPNVAKFMEHESFSEITSKLPAVDQIILQKYLIEGQRAPEVAKEINLGRSGLSHRATKIMDAIDVFNNGTEDEIKHCLDNIKHTTISKAKVVQKST